MQSEVRQTGYGKSIKSNKLLIKAMNLIPIYQQCFQAFQQSRWGSYSIIESMPIAYFGDLHTYDLSKIRIITVRLNPSSQEFPFGSPYLRFSATNYQQLIDNKDYKLYQKLLCDYYKKNPYLSWFNSFQEILRGLNVSYLDCSIYPNYVLHTDICSPVPTDPTWSKLSKLDRSNLYHFGQKIWHSLIEVLQPELILISVAQSYLQSIQFPQLTPWQVIYSVTHKKDGNLRLIPYEVKIAKFQVYNSQTYICFGSAAQTPFGSISNSQRLNLGQALARMVSYG